MLVRLNELCLFKSVLINMSWLIFSSMLKWKDSFVKIYEEIGGPYCTTDAIEYIEKFAYKSMVDNLNVFCTDYEDSDKCKKFETILNRRQSSKVKYLTPFPAILTLFESL